MLKDHAEDRDLRVLRLFQQDAGRANPEVSLTVLDDLWDNDARSALADVDVKPGSPVVALLLRRIVAGELKCVRPFELERDLVLRPARSCSEQRDQPHFAARVLGCDRIRGRATHIIRYSPSLGRIDDNTAHRLGMNPRGKFTFRTSITFAVMAFIFALAALLIAIQVRSLHLATREAASAY